MRLSAWSLMGDPLAGVRCCLQISGGTCTQLGEPGAWPVVGSVLTCERLARPEGGPTLGSEAGSGLKTTEGPGLSPPARGCQELPLGQTKSVWR